MNFIFILILIYICLIWFVIIRKLKLYLFLSSFIYNSLAVYKYYCTNDCPWLEPRFPIGREGLPFLRTLKLVYKITLKVKVYKRPEFVHKRCTNDCSWLALCIEIWEGGWCFHSPRICFWDNSESKRTQMSGLLEH